MDIILYTDGACKGNPGKGGWGVYLAIGGQGYEMCGGEQTTTNNRMELMAAIQGLNILSSLNIQIGNVTLFSDSTYVVKGISEWIPGWKRKGWRKADGKDVANKDLWVMLDQLNSMYRVEWKWVKAHSTDIYNQKADELANRGINTI